MTAPAGVVPDAEDASEASLREMLDAALEANRQLSELASGFLEEDALLRADLEKTRADLAVLQRMLFGRKSEKDRPGPPAGEGGDDSAGGGDGESSGGGKKDVKRGPGARAGRRDYSDLPRVEVIWDFPGGGYCCPECGEPFTPLGDHWSGERACSCRVPRTVMAPGPPKAIGKGLFGNGFIAMLLTERFAAGRSMNSLATGLARHGG